MGLPPGHRAVDIEWRAMLQPRAITRPHCIAHMLDREIRRRVKADLLIISNSSNNLIIIDATFATIIIN